MIQSREFIDAARAHGFDFFTGVPCSFLTPLINSVLSHPHLTYVGAASEGEAVAIAAGAWLAGRSSVVLCQNSGLGNAINPLTSLNAPFRIPVLLVTTWRGKAGLRDEPQHEVMGEITPDLLSLIGVKNAPFPNMPALIGPAFRTALDVTLGEELPYAWIMSHDDVATEALDQTPLPPPWPGEHETFGEGGPRPSRIAALGRFLDLVSDDTGVIATTGKCGRELFTLRDRDQHLYQVGSMGCASGMGLGVALCSPHPIVVLDGDGAALMKLGTFATIGAYAPKSLVHIILDNGVHDSTGGQSTVSPSVDFAAVARACGYRFTASCQSLAGFDEAYRRAAGEIGPCLIHLRIEPGSLEKLGRPEVKPAAVARRFKTFLATPAKAEAA